LTGLVVLSEIEPDLVKTVLRTMFLFGLGSFTHSKQDEQRFESLDTSEFVEEFELVEEKAMSAKLVRPSSAWSLQS
ncbi:hypothetical protein Tco_1580604, partial [Tanacetum coccineum]